MEAEIVLNYDDKRIAQAVAEAVSPDNFKTPSGLSIRTAWEGVRVFTEVECEKELSTFIATIDDLLFCVSTAEKIIHTTKRLR